METLEIEKVKKDACCDSSCCADEPTESAAIKEMVREKYTQIATQSKTDNETSCCGTGCGCGDTDYTIMNEDYSSLDGYNPDADLGLGCGIPTAFAQISEGLTVVDLGSGAGNDAFVARRLVGATGKVIGVDMTPVMIDRARINNDKLGYNNVEFRHGDIENLPVSENSTDVVVSNCVLNLVPDKAKAFSEIHRILKPGGHFSISDIVLEGKLPPGIQKAAEMYAGCVSGATQKDDYMKIIGRTGFIDVTIAKEKTIHIPDEILNQYLNNKELKTFKESGLRILSITVFGKKK